MEDLSLQFSFDSKQFGTLLIKYTIDTDLVSLEKISQNGIFWNFELEELQHQHNSFWKYFDKKELSLFKEKIKYVYDTKDKAIVNWSFTHSNFDVDYQGFIDYLFSEVNGDVYFNITVFKNEISIHRKANEIETILQLIHKEVENIGGEMFMVSDPSTEDIKYINEQALNLFNKKKEHPKNLTQFYNNVGLIVDNQTNITCGEDTVLAYFTPPNKGVKWIEIKTVFLNSKNHPCYKIDIICEVTEKVIINYRNDFYSKIINLHNQQIDFNGFVKQIMKSIVQFSDIDIAELWLVNYNEKYLKLSNSSINDKGLECFQTIDSLKIDEGLPSITFKKKGVTYFDDLTNNKHFLRNSLAKQLGLNSAVGVPLTAGKRVLGVLVTFSKKKLNENRSAWFFNSGTGSSIGWSVFTKEESMILSPFLISHHKFMLSLVQMVI